MQQMISMSVLAYALLAASANLTPKQLRCEYLVDPLGIEAVQPRLSWVDTSNERGAIQTAYRILVASSPEKLRAGQADLWDSGKVELSETAQIEYGGKPLVSREAAYWTVQVWDRNDRMSQYPGVAKWEMGLLSRSDWDAQWIGLHKSGGPAPTVEGASWIWYPEANARGEMPTGSCFLRKQVQIPTTATIESATLSASSDDHFKATINGKLAGVGDGWQTVHTLDVKKYLKSGANEVILEGINDKGKAAVAAILSIHTSDGTDQSVITDGSWESAKTLGQAWQTSLVVGPVGMEPWGIPSAPKVNGPAPYLRRDFDAASPVVKARIYVSALGLYKLYIDGRLVGHDLLRPGWTDYKKRVQYETYDVTDMIRRGPNAIGMVLGNGWYCGRVGWTPGQNYGPQAMGLVQLEMLHANGTRDQIISDGSWKAGTGPIVSDDLLDGENYDARLEVHGGYPAASSFRNPTDVDKASWSEAEVPFGPSSAPLVKPLTNIALNAQQSPPVQVLQEIKPLTVKENPKGSYIFDLGQNMVGFARLKVQGPSGTIVRLRFAEMLNPDGSIYTTNLRGAKATDTYTLKGNGVETYQPSFTFHGFRYVELTGYPGRPGKDAVTGIVIGSNNPLAGEFECSNSLVNQLSKNIFWGQRGNYVDVPTDCPQRDERLGWMGDAEIFARTATYDNDIAAFMTKWTRDVDDAQSPAGGFSDVSPRVVDGGDGAPAWGDAGVIVPWTMYQAYGDKRLLVVDYPYMAKWIEYIDSVNPDHIWTNHSNANFGDWLNVQDDTPRPVLATAFFAHSADLMARTAEVLGKTEDAEKYRNLLAEIKEAFNAKFVASNGTIRGDTQTDYVLALSFGLLSAEMEKIAIKKLADHILIDRKGHLSTGFVGVGHLCPTLTKFGRIDIAYKLLETDTYPSWGYSIRQGATTIWERWDGWTADKGFQDPGMNSFNHYSLGSVGEWMYNWILGIDEDSADPGYGRIILHPAPGGGMTWARGRLSTMHGEVKSEWHWTPDSMTLEVAVPANTTATLYLPCSANDTVTESGRSLDRDAGVTLAKGQLGLAATHSAGSPVVELGGGAYHFKIDFRK